MLIFLDPDPDCKSCKGKGYKDVNVGTAEVPDWLRGICTKCSEVCAGTLLTTEYSDEDGRLVHSGTIVPDKD